jgi:hypothetical protein
LNTRLSEQLHAEGLLSEQSMERIRHAESEKLFSIFWEIRTLLYVGVLLLTTGLGILIYKNIDTIGHQVVLALIAALCIGCFYYCVKRKYPFSRTRVQSPNTYFDYVLLLGCLTMLTFLAYLQAQYVVFGEAYGLATFIPMLILFFCAYYFDHLGVLSLAITNLAAWLGIAVTPTTILRGNNFAEGRIIFAGILLGIFLTAVAYFSDKRNLKKHFSFTYLNFGMNILFIAILAGMFYFESFYAAWIFPLAAAAYYFYRKAFEQSSFYFLLMIVIYSYIGVSYVAVRAVVTLLDDIFLPLMYFIMSGIGVIVLLIQLNAKMKRHARLQQ